MKKIIINIIALFTLLLLVNCQEDNFTFGSIATPSNLELKYEIVGKTDLAPDGDGSGKIKFTTTADNAISYKYVFSDGTSENAPSGYFEKRFTNYFIL